MRHLLATLLFLLSVVLHAQDSLITVNKLPEEVRVGQIYNVTWWVQDADAGVMPPDEFPGFEKIGGPVEATNVNNTNNVTVRTVSYSYSLRVAEAGIIALPVFQAEVKGNPIRCASPQVRSLAEGQPGSTPDAMSKALTRQVYPDGMLAAHVYKDGAYISRMDGSDEVVQRFLTKEEARALETYLRALIDKK